ncbi:MAG: M1 family metallopeptidase, partial [Bacteroidota bacterium]|nr:M1 family metallopeptidase [Bacteroidota bacterium]
MKERRKDGKMLPVGIFPSFLFSFFTSAPWKHAPSGARNCALGITFILTIFISASAPAQDFGRRARAYDVQHYDIRVRLDEETQRVDGEVRIRLRPFDAGLDTLAFDAVNMEIRDVLFLSEDGGEGKSVPYAYDSLTLRVPRPARERSVETVLVRYRCRPQRGLYFIQPDASFPDDPRQVWTQGQREDNRHWFPCFDYPSDKATSEVRMTVDTALQALSNGRLVSRAENGDGTATWHYALTNPHSSYLVMLAAGKYRRFRQVARCALPDGRLQYVPVDSWYYPGDDAADVRRTFMDTADMLAFFTARLGVPYPWSRYSQVPVAHFLYGGMENTTATVMADTRLVVDARSALDYDPQPLIAHELAHQWVGDYVTYVDWQHEWLNEGFATFLQQLWTRHRNGEEDFLLQRFDGIRSYMDWTDRAGRLPVVHRTSTSAANTYSKGAAVLHMLRDLLGEADFWEVMRRWLEDNAFGSVETHDFRRLAEQVSGRDLAWYFEQWLFGAGYPELEITRSSLRGGRAMQVTVRQVQATDSLCGYFRLPLAWSWPGAAQSGTIWVDGAETVDTIPVPADGAIPLFDPQR